MAKKSFTMNPAEAFFTAPAPTQEAPAAASVAEVQTASSPAQETKSKRVQLLMRPSTLDGMKARAAQQGISMNELVARVLDAYLAGQN